MVRNARKYMRGQPEGDTNLRLLPLPVHTPDNTNIQTMKYLLSLLALTATSVAAFVPLTSDVSRTTHAVAPVVVKATASEEFYIDEERRFIMNVLMVGAGGVVVAGFGIPFILFFVPPGSGGGSAGVTAKDALGNDIVAKDYLATKPANDRSLAQGLKGDAT
jgi:hypothetical protein